MADRRQQRRQLFRYLLLFRWASLLPVLVALLLTQSTSGAANNGRVLLLAIAINAVITLFGERINQALMRRPALLVIDLVISGLLVWFTGAESSPYFLYSLTPILGAAFFFGIRGGLLAAGVYTLLYLPAVFFAPRPAGSATNLSAVASQIIAFFLIGFVFGYASELLADLRDAHDKLAVGHAELSQRNRDLHLIQKLTLILQSSVDPVELEETIVRGLVEEMGYRRAVIGLFEQGDQVLSSWLTMENIPISTESKQMGHTEAVPLTDLDSPVARAIRTQSTVEVLDGEPPVGARQFDKRLAAGKHYIILPLALRDNLLGVILLDHLPVSQPLSPADHSSLERLAAHAGVALGSVQLCINRAQREAIVEERNRIAADLHDSISQVLYGMAYGLDACIQLLPNHPDAVRNELQKLHPVVTDAQAQMRTAIFDMRSDEIGSDTFSARLHRHLNAICPARSLALRIELPGEFEQWPSEIRYDLFRIAQEAMTNAARHADAQRIVITVAQGERQIEVRVEDDGRGFVPQEVDAARHLGIQSMAERVERLGGVLNIKSTPSDGTVVSAMIPE